MRPDARDSDDEGYGARESLSDFSDYDSSDEETHKKRTGTSQPSSTSYGASSSKRYTNVTDDDDVDVRADPRQGLTQEDPFADPFADQQEVSTPGITHRKQMDW